MGAVVTLDLSLTGTGMCCNGHTECWKNKLRGHERLQFILKKVQETIKVYDPECVYIERPTPSPKQGSSSILDLGGLAFLVRHYLWATGIPYYNVSPGSIKKYATGKGNANKNEMVAAAIRDFGFQGSDDNEADALLLWHLAMEHRGTPVVKVNKEKAAAAQKVELIPSKGA